MSAVHFVGAGPGAPDLITVRGKALLEKAGLIIYTGSLVPAAILDCAKADCVRMNSAEMTLDEVVAAIRSAVEDGHDVVRLHTGDPCLYGAIREQMDRLDELGIIYDVCPGVSSFCAAAAALKTEYTLPGVSQTVIITRTPGRTPVPERESLRELARHGATMVLFLSASLLESASAELIAGGYKPETPAAIVYAATHPDEKIVRCTVETLARQAAGNRITKTALVCVGDFLGEDYELSRLYSADFSTGHRKAAE